MKDWVMIHKKHGSGNEGKGNEGNGNGNGNGSENLKCTIDSIRTATNKDKVLGNDRFKEEIGQMLQRRIDNYQHGGDRKSETFKQAQTQNEQ